MKNWNGFLSSSSQFHKLLGVCLLLVPVVCRAQAPEFSSRIDYPALSQTTYLQSGWSVADTTNPLKKYPDPHKVMLRSAIIPGWGQVINNQIYKVPIIYALLGGLAWYSIYLTKEYHDYRAAFYNLNSKTPDDLRFGPTPAYLKNASTTFLRKRRDMLHNRRDFIYITIVLAYGLNILDAYIFAHLRTFNVSKDLSVRTTIHPGMMASALPGITISFSLLSK